MQDLLGMRVCAGSECDDEHKGTGLLFCFRHRGESGPALHKMMIDPCEQESTVTVQEL